MAVRIGDVPNRPRVFHPSDLHSKAEREGFWAAVESRGRAGDCLVVMKGPDGLIWCYRPPVWEVEGLWADGSGFAATCCSAHLLAMIERAEDELFSSANRRRSPTGVRVRWSGGRPRRRTPGPSPFFIEWPAPRPQRPPLPKRPAVTHIARDPLALAVAGLVHWCHDHKLDPRFDFIPGAEVTLLRRADGKTSVMTEVVLSTFAR